MVHTWQVTIPELTGDKPRRAYIYLPDTYNWAQENHYPVLYMFDGHNVFFDSDATYGKSWGMQEYLDGTHTQIIVAAVECNDDANNGRLKEYSPYSFKDNHFGNIEGLGKITMDWFVNSFKPMIDDNFRTIRERDYTYIGGSSMGGLMSLYAVLQYNHIFSRAAVLSPSLWTAPGRLKSLAKRADLIGDTVVYMDYGSEEMEHRSRMNTVIPEMTSILISRNIFVTTRIVPHGTHCEACWERQIPFFMNTLLYY